MWEYWTLDCSNGTFVRIRDSSTVDPLQASGSSTWMRSWHGRSTACVVTGSLGCSFPAVRLVRATPATVSFWTVCEAGGGRQAGANVPDLQRSRPGDAAVLSAESGGHAI